MAFGEYWDTCEYTDGVLNYNQVTYGALPSMSTSIIIHLLQLLHHALFYATKLDFLLHLFVYCPITCLLCNQGGLLNVTIDIAFQGYSHRQMTIANHSYVVLSLHDRMVIGNELSIGWTKLVAQMQLLILPPRESCRRRWAVMSFGAWWMLRWGLQADSEGSTS